MIKTKDGIYLSDIFVALDKVPGVLHTRIEEFLGLMKISVITTPGAWQEKAKQEILKVMHGDPYHIEKYPGMVDSDIKVQVIFVEDTA